MKKWYIGILMAALMVVSMPLGAVAAEKEKPAQFAFWPPLQVWDKDTSIKYFRFNLLYGVNKNVSVFDLGVANHATGNVTGVQLGMANIVEGDFIAGWQSGVVNMTAGNFTGCQLGIFNKTNKHCKGVQLGFVNSAGSLYGLQLGLLNIHENGSKYMKFLPVVNWAF